LTNLVERIEALYLKKKKSLLKSNTGIEKDLTVDCQQVKILFAQINQSIAKCVFFES
jgi:hypothetical protein